MFLLGFVVFLVSIKASAYLLVFAIETGLVHGSAKISPLFLLAEEQVRPEAGFLHSACAAGLRLATSRAVL